MMNNAGLLKYRLLQQHIAQPDFDTPAQAAAWLGATQAQDYWSGKWSLGLRMKTGTQAAVEAALTNREIVRTWAMRGTLHLIAASDVHWILDLLRPRIVSQLAGNLKRLELDSKLLTKCRNIITKALQGEKQLSREELKETLEQQKIRTDEHRLGMILYDAAAAKLICLGNRRDKEYTYTLLDEWIPAVPAIAEQEALAALTLRYFNSRGPATVNDFAGWSGLTITAIKGALENVKQQLHQEVIDGQTYWMAADLSAKKVNTSQIHLLPGFDEYVLGYKDRNHFLEPEQFQHIVPGRNGIFQPTIVVNGKIAGTWKRTYKKDTVIIDLHPFDTFSSAQLKAITTAAKRYGRFEGLQPVLPAIQ